MKRFLVSACLAGVPCRHDGRANLVEAVAEMVARGEAVAICPEVAGGLPVPRVEAEVQGGSGDAVLQGRARVVGADGRDLTESFLAGAHAALRLARAFGATAAVLKARSPSCGSGAIYDGTFSRKLVPGDGVAAALLKRAGLEVMSDEEFSP